MKGGGQNLWNGIAVCEASQTSWQMEKTLHDRRFGEPLTADLKELEKLEASDIYPEELTRKDVLIRQEQVEFIFPIADGTAKLWRRDHEF